MLTQRHVAPSVRRVPRDPQPDWVLAYRQLLGDRIRARRIYQDLTQQQMVEQTGIDRATYQRIERGTSDPRISDLVLIARVLDVDVGDLVRGGDRPPQ
jgi:transcriptional regulator with XRE-family HTH domain